MEKLRIDKWLQAARFFKTRSLAAKAVLAGHVRLNGNRCKPAHEIRVGDTLDILRGTEQFEVAVAGLSATRGPAPVARTLYEETPASVQRREEQQALHRAGKASQPASGRRPTKRERRQLDHWRDSH